MSNPSNNPWDLPEQDPWNQGTYRTGSTRPPKNHGGIIAVLLVLVILLSGIITIMGVVNVRLFRQVNKQSTENTLPISFSNEDTDHLATIPPEDISIAATEACASLHLEDPAVGVENIPQEGGLSLQDIYASVIDSVVSISCTDPSGSSTGTGVIISESGYIVTNCHVVEGAWSITEGIFFS